MQDQKQGKERMKKEMNGGCFFLNLKGGERHPFALNNVFNAIHKTIVWGC